MSKYVEAFVIGGTLIATSKWVSNNVRPSIAALFGGLPTGIFASFFIDNVSKKEQYFHGYIFNSFVLFLSIVLIYNLLHYTDLNPNFVCFFGLILWALISYTALRIYGLT